MNIIISAYACETGRGGEGEIGWRLVHELAQKHRVRVITRANLRPVHDASFLDAPKPPGLHFEYFDLPWIFRFYKKGKRLFLLYYYLWQLGVWFRARRMLREERADLLHHLIGGMDWMPSGLSLCREPFVWGPVGSEDTHPIIFEHLPLRSRLKDKARNALRWGMRNVDPFTRITASRANIILSHTPETLPARYRKKIRPFVQTGITDLESLARPKTDFRTKGRLRLVYAGELKDWKGARIALDAALRYFESDPNADLVVAGDGPLRIEMENVATRHPEGWRVRFLGKVPMSQLVDTLNASDIFLYPSFHHGLATVVLQAMLTRLPIICIEGDATGRTVGMEAGITVPLSKAQAPFIDVAKAIAELANDRSRREMLARTARCIALERFNYGVLGRELGRAYYDSIEKTRQAAPRGN